MTETVAGADQSKSEGQKWPGAGDHAIFWSIVVVGIVADLWSKWAVFKWLQGMAYNEKIFVEGYFSFVTALNNGAAFSIMAGKQPVLIAVSAVAMVAVVCIFLFGKIMHKTMVVSLGLFMAGIVGNLYDRVTTGQVRDFIDVHYKEVYHWPAFNVADSMLCTAVGLMIIMQIVTACQKSDHPQKSEP